MKRLFLLSALLASSLALFCQKPSLNKAYGYYYEKNFEKAKEAIELCVQDEKLSAKATTWLYKANIDYFLAQQEYSKRQKNEQYAVLFPHTPEEAYDAFLKAQKLNRNIAASGMFSPDEGLAKMYVFLVIEGVDMLIGKEYEGARRVLGKAVESYEMQTPEYPMNGQIYYYYAYALEMLKQPDEAIKAYEKAIEDHSDDINVYLRLIENYKSENAKEKVYRTIESAKNALPGNIDVQVAEIDYYYWTKEIAKGRELLQKLPSGAAKTPNTAVNIANIHIADSNYREAEKLLQSAYNSTPANFPVIYNLGICCYYLSQEKFDTANQYDIKGNKEMASSVKKESDEYLDKAERYFEEALRMEPDDESVLNVLKSIYARKQSPKYDDILKRLESIK